MRQRPTGSAYGPEPDAVPDKESSDERDARMEARFTYDRRGERSTPAFVDAYRNELVREFFDWRAAMTSEGNWMGEGIFDALRRWERSRFGSDLDNCSHGILLFGVKIQLAPEQGGRRLPEGYFSKRQGLDRPLPSKLPNVIADKAAKRMEMPKPPSKAELERQQRQILSETEEP